MDGLTKTPAAGALNVATFHLESVPGHRGQLLYAVIYDATSKQMILRSELYLRAGCSWEYFSDPFTCNTDLLTIYVHGMDETNQEFRRQIMAYCLNGTLSTRQPATVGPSTLPPVTFLNAYLYTRYESSQLFYPTAIQNFTCENGSWFIQVDTNTTQMFVSITSAYGSLGVHDPAGNPVAADVLYNNGNQKLYAVDTTRMPGFYTVSAGSIGACYISVYSVGGAVVYGYFAQPSSVDPLGTHMDGLTKTPAAGALNVATFHLESVPGHRGQLLYAVIFDATSKQMILRSELYLRAGCSWEYFSDPFTCNTDLLTIYVHGMDETNQEFRRQIMAYCLNGTLSTRQPATVGTTTLPPFTVPLTTATTAANVATGTPVITVAPPITTQTTKTVNTTTPPVTTAGTTKTVNTAAPPVTTAGTTRTVNTATPPVTTAGTTRTVNTATPPVTTAGTTKTAAPPKTTATPSGPVTTSSTYGNTQLDVVFLIDGSKPATNLYNDMTQFVTSLMSPFSVGQDYARVGLIPVFGSPGGDGISQAGFSTISSQNQLVQYLSQMQGGWGDFVSSGEFTNTAILTAMDPSYVSATSGYRSSISNHLMVYITANTAFSDNPTTVKALQSNTYGVITIGYGTGATDAATLQTLAGGAACTFTAANSATLQGLVPQVQSLIFKARLNGGKYCGNGN